MAIKFRAVTFVLVLCFAGRLCGQISGASGRRLALLIGVTNYKSEFKPLVTPIENVEGLERELKSMHFDDVQEETDKDPTNFLTHESLVTAIKGFSSKLRPGDTAFFYFSGHGVRISGRQYVLPADVSAATMEERGLAVGWIADSLASSKAKAIFIVIESCTINENGTPTTSPQEDVLGPPTRTFIVYPVQGNQPATDRAELRTGRSFFADSLISVLEQTCLDYSEAFGLLKPLLDLRKQVPEFVGKLDQRFSFWCPSEVRESNASGQTRMNMRDSLMYSFIQRGKVTLGCTKADSSCSYGPEPWVFPEQTRLDRGCLPDGSHCQSEEAFHRTIEFTTDFWIGQTEVTVDAYRRVMKFLPADSPIYNLGWFLPKLPVTMVSFKEAEAYCAKAGGHLPSELEWEFAARRGFEGQDVIYPWTDAEAKAPHDYSNFGGDDSTGLSEGRDRWQDGPAPVAWFPPIAGTMLFDIAGNVAEWIGVPYTETIDNSGVVKGGSWRSSAFDLRLSARLPVSSESRDDSIGFRCAMPADALR
jgi:hypothetical protein